MSGLTQTLSGLRRRCSMTEVSQLFPIQSLQELAAAAKDGAALVAIDGKVYNVANFLKVRGREGLLSWNPGIRRSPFSRRPRPSPLSQLNAGPPRRCQAFAGCRRDRCEREVQFDSPASRPHYFLAVSNLPGFDRDFVAAPNATHRMRRDIYSLPFLFPFLFSLSHQEISHLRPEELSITSTSDAMHYKPLFWS